MRPYRAIPIDGKDFVYGWYCNLAGLSYIAKYPVGAGIIEGKKSIGGWIQVITSTVGQQIGLKDKNGKGLDWWEGDIVKDTRSFTSKKERFYEIVFMQGCFWLKSIHGNLCLTCECLTPFLHTFNKIGTIHTHPELMEGK